MKHLHDTGFVAPPDLACGERHGASAIAALVMVTTLMFGTLAAATAVTIGLARSGDKSPLSASAYASALTMLPRRG